MKVIVDHVLKNIEIYDLKCVWNVEDFYDNYYLYRRAYIQAYLYYWAVKYWAKQPGLEDYHVEFPKFMTCDSINYYMPLIRTLYGRDLGEAYDGFETKGKTYPGVQEIIKDLKWAKENNQWRISKKNFENDGIIHIKG